VPADRKEDPLDDLVALLGLGFPDVSRIHLFATCRLLARNTIAIDSEGRRIPDVEKAVLALAGSHSRRVAVDGWAATIAPRCGAGVSFRLRRGWNGFRGAKFSGGGDIPLLARLRALRLSDARLPLPLRGADGPWSRHEALEALFRLHEAGITPAEIQDGLAGLGGRSWWWLAEDRGALMLVEQGEDGRLRLPKDVVGS